MTTKGEKREKYSAHIESTKISKMTRAHDVFRASSCASRLAVISKPLLIKRKSLLLYYYYYDYTTTTIIATAITTTITTTTTTITTIAITITTITYRYLYIYNCVVWSGTL